MIIFRPLTLLLLIGAAIAAPAQVHAESKESPHSASHKQTRVISPTHKGNPITLNTFCLDTDGNILACVGGDTVEYVPSEDGSYETKTVKAPKLVQKYSPDGKLLQETELEFKPTAINQGADGTVFVAGVGRIAQLSKDGKILVAADSPHIGDVEEMKEKATKAAEEQMKQLTGSLTMQVERIDQMLKTLEEKPEAELTDREKKRIETLGKQKQLYCDQEKQMAETYKSFFSVDSMLERSMEITSLAVTSKDVFLCCGSLAGHGYEVWRTDHDLSSPKKVVDGLGGCCGQCDIQANDDYLILAENTKFQVGLLDRDGNRVSSFGKQDRKSPEGFGSCCNPMNVRCCSNGDILTAESSIGFIKRFNSEGELVGTVGKAKIGGGCKHVAIGYDEKKDHYYMQYQDRNQICVLVPLSEAPEFTEDELLAKAAKEGLAKTLIGDGTKLSGEWSLSGQRPEKTAAGGIFGMIANVLGSSDQAADGDSDEQTVEDVMADQKVTYFSFSADGGLQVRGGYFEDGDNSWEAISQDEQAKKLRFSHLQDGVQYYDYEVEFIDDNKAKFSTLYGDQVLTTDVYTRLAVADDTAKPESTAGAAELKEKPEVTETAGEEQ